MVILSASIACPASNYGTQAHQQLPVQDQTGDKPLGESAGRVHHLDVFVGLDIVPRRGVALCPNHFYTDGQVKNRAREESLPEGPRARRVRYQPAPPTAKPITA